MRAKIKAICPRCNSIIIERRSLIKGMIRASLIIFVMVTSLFGTLALYNAFQGSIFNNPDRIMTFGGAIATILNVGKMFQTSAFLDNQTKEITKDCPNDTCKAKKLYAYLSTFEANYSVNPLSPEENFKNKQIDCDSGSYLFCSMFKEFSNKKCDIICNAEYEGSLGHCWVVANLEGNNTLIDIGLSRWEEV